ncbi:uncharacterized protein LOC142766108 [Rhipicephalus microplus]|uniref:uncharacterized protein LOC142766108 n=1 Tax=Rhipicephalus microplus TaxID=6941 RepID=UPI003F6A56C8
MPPHSPIPCLRAPPSQSLIGAFSVRSLPPKQPHSARISRQTTSRSSGAAGLRSCERTCASAHSPGFHLDPEHNLTAFKECCDSAKRARPSHRPLGSVLMKTSQSFCAEVPWLPGRMDSATRAGRLLLLSDLARRATFLCPWGDPAVSRV